MSNLIRWEPAREMVTLREAMDRLFDDAFTHPFSRVAGIQLPAVDLYQTDSDVVVLHLVARSQGRGRADHHHRRNAEHKG